MQINKVRTQPGDFSSCFKRGLRSFYKSKVSNLGILLLLSFMLMSFSAFPQLRTLSLEPDSVYNPKRVRVVAATTGALYLGAMAGLYQLWYKDYSLTAIHSFNDNNEWLKMDKVGHVGSAYYLGKMGIGLLKWAGVNNTKSAWYGGLMGAFFQTSVEVFDGVSPAWGFSWGDVTANFAGSALLIAQQLAWEEQRIQFKFSFHQTRYSYIRPDQLGNSFIENVFKDYNGQTYWLSANIYSFLPPSSRFPKWLNIAAGYGAEGMTGAVENEPGYGYTRYRQFYLAPDIDLSKIKTRSRLVNTLFYTFGFIKFPLPGLEIRQPGKTRLLPVAF